MCDYSLMGLPNRLAMSDEVLVVHRFPTNTLGLVSPSDVASAVHCEKTSFKNLWGALKHRIASIRKKPVTAVCIPPGSRLLLQDIPAHLREQIEVAPVEPVVFTQLTASPYAHRDAIRFRNGVELLLQRLSVGQRVTVLSVSSDVDEPIPQPTRTDAPKEVFS